MRLYELLRPVLRELDQCDWLKAQTIGATRWADIVNDTAPNKRSVTSLEWAGIPRDGFPGAPAVERVVAKPYVSWVEAEEIVALARQHNLALLSPAADALLAFTATQRGAA